MKILSTARRPMENAGAEPVAADKQPTAVVLSNGRYSVQLSPAGSGYSSWNGIAVTRWRADETRDADGLYVYFRDLDREMVWSAGYQPTRRKPSRYEFHAGRYAAQIVREDASIECRLTTFVVPQHDCELRLCRLTNHGSGK